jgi:CheY-like chemotaxis protein
MNGGEKPERVAVPSPFEFLVVSADYPTLSTVQAGLKEFGATLGCANTIASAQDYLTRRKLDGIILDLDLATSLDLITFTRASTSNRGALIFACARDHFGLSTALGAGANLALRKPLNSEYLLSKLRAAQTLMLQERRRFFRHPVSTTVDLKADLKEQRAIMINLSEGGMAVRSQPPLECGTLADFSFRLATAPAIDGRGQVLWANSEALMGIEFLFFRGASKQHLLNWISSRPQT